MDQELLLKAQFLQNQSQELEQNIEHLEKELQDLSKMNENISFLINNDEKSAISSLGKGVHIKTNIESKELFVEVGAGVIIKKTPDETQKVIKAQIEKLTEANLALHRKLDIYQKTFESIIEDIEKQQADSSEERAAK